MHRSKTPSVLIQGLEPRTLFAAAGGLTFEDVVHNPGTEFEWRVLRVIGTKGADKLDVQMGNRRRMGTVLNLRLNGGSPFSVKANVNSIEFSLGAGNDTLKLSKSGLTRKFVNVNVDAGKGNDNVTFAMDSQWTEDEPNTWIIASAYGGEGDDRMTGLDTFDTGDYSFAGGPGKDSLYGAEGNDFLYGGDGNDSLFGNDGDDFLHGEAGNDQAFGGDGFNTFWISDGADKLVGGDDGNAFHFEYLQYSPDFTPDSIVGGTGHDQLIVLEKSQPTGYKLTSIEEIFVLGSDNGGGKG